MTVDLEASDKKDRTDDEEGHERQHLDQRGPELQLPEEALTEIRFIDNTTTSAIKRGVHCGTAWNAFQ